MKVTLRSDDAPDVMIEANEAVNLRKLDQHIRTLHTARRWLLHEMKIKREREAANAAAAKKAAQQKTPASV